MIMRTRAAFWIAATALLLCLLTACGMINPKDSLNGSAWILSYIDHTPPLDGRLLTVKFAEGQISGSSGCNSYSGPYEVNGEKISNGPIAVTMMACAEPGMMEQERIFLGYLQNAKSFKLSEGQLQIFRTDGKVLTFIPQG